MILLWGLPGDGPMAQVRDALSQLGFAATFVDQRTTIDASAELFVGSQLAGMVRIDGGVLDLRCVTAAYMRSYDPRQFPQVMQAGPGSDIWERAVWIEDILSSWADVSDALVINKPSACVSNSSKPFQAKLIRSLGFDVPKTIITTDPEAILEFVATCGKVVYKSTSSVRSVVSELTDKQMSRLDDVCWCPTQFQEFIPGTDYRVHVVGEEIFAAEIVSGATDYRYAARQGCSVEIRAASIPDELAALCVAASKELGLSVSGIDLRRHPEGKWFCFEVNPSPAFSFYQAATHQPMDEAIARLLIRGRCS
jgi:hypothetical protein